MKIWYDLRRYIFCGFFTLSKLVIIGKNIYSISEIFHNINIIFVRRYEIIIIKQTMRFLNSLINKVKHINMVAYS